MTAPSPRGEVEKANYLRKEVIGNATLYLGDCREILPTLGKVDAVVTDPPYEFATSGGGIFRRDRDNMDQIQAAGLDQGFEHDLLTSGQFGCVVVFAHNDQWAALLPVIAHAYQRYAICQWHKTNPMPVANKHYQPDTEIYVHAWNQGFHPAGDLCQKQRFILATNGQDGTIAHPTVKPLSVMRKIICNVTGLSICDPFMGSGSTGVATVESGRTFVGIERDPGFFDIACRRIEDAQRQGSLFGERAA